jgi:hypothetical protein
MENVATTAAEFHVSREKGELITLPSTGRKVRMKAVKPAELLRLGDIPDVLSDLVVGFLYGSITEEEYKKFFSPKEKKEQAIDLINSMELVCRCALMEPKISDVPDLENNYIVIDDLEDSEQRFIFDLAMLGVTSLKSFRKEQEASLAVVANEQDNGTETE